MPTYLIRRTARSNGFTLLELVLVMAVIAILTGIAVPAWQDQLRKSRRADAMDALAALQQAQERWRGQSPSYAGTLSALSQPSTSAAGRYALSIADADASGYTLEARAIDGTSQANDAGCTTLAVVLSDGTAAFRPTDCWRK